MRRWAPTVRRDDPRLRDCPIVTEHREKLTLEAALELVAERRRLAARQPLELPAAGPSTET